MNKQNNLNLINSPVFGSITDIEIFIPKSSATSKIAYLETPIFSKVNLDPSEPPFFCLLLLDQKGQDLKVGSETEYHFAQTLSNFPIKLLSEEEIEVSTNLTFQEGKLCSRIFSFSDFEIHMGSFLNLKINLSSFQNVFPFIKPNQLELNVKLDECKAGEVFDGTICAPCQRNYYSNEKLTGDIYMCKICNDYENFNCYGSNYRSPKKDFWRLSHDSQKFLRCPNKKCLGDL